MSEMNEAWRAVADRFTALGNSFRDHYRKAEVERVDLDEEAEEKVKEALETLGEALNTTFTSLGNAVRDQEVQTQAKDAAKSLVDALGETFSEVGEQVRDVFERRKESDLETAPTETRHVDIEVEITEEEL